MKTLLLAAALLTVSSVVVFAQTIEPRRLHHKETHAAHIPPQETPEGLTIIFSNLGTSKDYLYNYKDTWLVAGPDSIVGLSNFIAMPFTPQANSHISQVQVAVLYDLGANQVNISIYADTKGHPGKMLAGPVTVTNLPKGINCCQLSVAGFSPVAVNAGTQYWVVANTPKSGQGSDFLGEWAGEVAPVLTLAADVAGSGWVAFNGNGFPAGEVLGTVP